MGSLMILQAFASAMQSQRLHLPVCRQHAGTMEPQVLRLTLSSNKGILLTCRMGGPPFLKTRAHPEVDSGRPGEACAFDVTANMPRLDCAAVQSQEHVDTKFAAEARVTVSIDRSNN
ncbi:hypothetical protein AK812_SmicGene24251 [Symbiodinium microadriaticum]|uniref:Uncharacterized protein n=1 Tax=Symbiodinium microadriaticum TaxID=2951 RepID=A0A1Q9DF65_SYMMI|nr:hypothetical protein AK812_SmicGene24251 [Symbiodinium microadriaticum]